MVSLGSRSGIFTVLFVITTYVLRRTDAAKTGLNKIMLGTAIAMYILATVVNDHLSITRTRYILIVSRHTSIWG